MAILKATKSTEILDLLAQTDTTLRELLTDTLTSEDVDEFILTLMPATVLNQMLTELRQRAHAHVA